MWPGMHILPQFSKGHNQTPNVVPNYMPRTAELLHDMHKLQRMIDVRELLRVVSWKIRHNKNIWGWKPSKKNIEAYRNFTGFYKGLEALHEIQTPWNIKWNIIYFGAMFFEVRGRIFLKVKIFKTPSLIFVLCLLKCSWRN